MMISIRKCLPVMALLLTSLSLTSCKTTELQQVVDALGGFNQPLNKETVSAGLKQALQVGTENAVFKTNKAGGFSNNPAIQILVPEKLNKLAKTVRQIGLGSYVDNFELQMNRAAETASAEAKAVFFNAINQMTLQDAWGILRGGENAATSYFRKSTESSLRQRFQPIITNSMQKIGFYNDYQKLVTTYNSLPLSNKTDINIENYVMDEALDGLFTLVAEEEAKIRQNPVARTTDLLRKVFSQQ